MKLKNTQVENRNNKSPLSQSEETFWKNGFRIEEKNNSELNFICFIRSWNFPSEFRKNPICQKFWGNDYKKKTYFFSVSCGANPLPYREPSSFLFPHVPHGSGCARSECECKPWDSLNLNFNPPAQLSLIFHVPCDTLSHPTCAVVSAMTNGSSLPVLQLCHADGQKRVCWWLPVWLLSERLSSCSDTLINSSVHDPPRTRTVGEFRIYAANNKLNKIYFQRRNL